MLQSGLINRTLSRTANTAVVVVAPTTAVVLRVTPFSSLSKKVYEFRFWDSWAPPYSTSLPSVVAEPSLYSTTVHTTPRQCCTCYSILVRVVVCSSV